MPTDRTRGGGPAHHETAPTASPNATNPANEVPPQRTATSTSTTSDETWTQEATEAVLLLATSGDTFTTDSIRELGVGEPSNPQRWAALIHRFASTGSIVCVGTTLVIRPNGKEAPTRMWRGTRTHRRERRSGQ